MLPSENPSLGKVIIHKLDFNPLVFLSDEHVSDVPSLALNLLKAPDLTGDPALVDALDVAHNELSVALSDPAILEKIVIKFIDSHKPRLALDRTKKPVRVLTEGVVEAASLMGAREARG